MPKTTGGGSSISRKDARTISKKASATGEKTGRVTAARSKALIVSGNKTFAKADAQVRAAGAPKRKAAVKAKKYLAKSSGTTVGEARGVIQELRRGEISKGTAIKRMKGGPRAGVKASPANKRKVARAIRKAR